MKKICLALLALLMCLTLSCGALAQGEQGVDAAAAELLAQVLHMADVMQQCAQSDAYCSAYAGAEEILTLCAQMGQGEYGAPGSALLLTLDENALALIGTAAMDGAEISDAVRQKIYAALPAALCTQCVARGGTSALAASAMLSYGECIVLDNNMPRAAVLQVSFDSAYDVLCAFYTNDQAITHCTAYFAPAGSGLADYGDEIRSVLGQDALRELTADELAAAHF